ncbi:hypothetical protein EBX93_12325 [bacterium]|nr:hypothetical protein [bacterium]
MFSNFLDNFDMGIELGISIKIRTTRGQEPLYSVVLHCEGTSIGQIAWGLANDNSSVKLLSWLNRAELARFLDIVKLAT